MLIPSRVTGLVLEEEVVHAAQLRRGPGGVEVEKGATGAAKTPEELQAFLRGAGLDLSHTVLCLPRRMAVVSFLEIPSARASEIAEMVRLEALRRMPFPAEEILADFELLRTDARGYSQVLMLVVRSPEVERLLARLHGAGVFPRRAVLSPQAFAALARPAVEPGFVVVVEAGPERVGFDFLEGGRLVFTRLASLGKVREEERALRVVEELRVSMAAYGKHNPVPERIELVLLPDGEGGTDLKKRLAAEHPLRELDPLSRLGKSSDLSWPPGAGPLAALGAALAAEERPDFLPWPERRRLESSRRRREWGRVAALAGTLALLWAAMGTQKLQRAQSRLARLDREWEAMAPRVRELGRMSKQVLIVREKTRGTARAIDLLELLHRAVPAQISLSAFSFEGDGRVTLRGLAPSLSEAVSLIPLLERSAVFEGMELKSSNAMRQGGLELVEFQLQGRARERP